MSSKSFIKPGVLVEEMNGIRRLDVEDVLFEKREIYITSSIDADTCAGLLMLLNYMEHDGTGEEIKIYINSPGGSVVDGTIVYDYISSMKTPVTTVCIGCAASMAAIIYLAGDKRLMFPNSKVMIHDPSYGNADFSGYKAEEIMEKANELMESTLELRHIVAKRTGRELSEVAKKMRKDSYFNASEAVEFGLATEVVKTV